jgi:hypothetical protein
MFHAGEAEARQRRGCLCEQGSFKERQGSRARARIGGQYLSSTSSSCASKGIVKANEYRPCNPHRIDAHAHANLSPRWQTTVDGNFSRRSRMAGWQGSIRSGEDGAHPPALNNASARLRHAVGRSSRGRLPLRVLFWRLAPAGSFLARNRRTQCRNSANVIVIRERMAALD